LLLFIIGLFGFWAFFPGHFNYMIYGKKDRTGKYPETLIVKQFPELNDNIFYSKENDTPYKVDGKTVYKRSFENNSDVFYYYHMSWKTIPNYNGDHYKIAFPHVYFEKNDEIAFDFKKNPESCFVSNGYLYYVYGKEYLNKEVTFYSISEFFMTQTHNYKDLKYARVNLKTLKTEIIKKDDYDSSCKKIWKIYYPEKDWYY